MLINFRFANYRSFLEPTVLSMEALELPEMPESVMDRDGLKLLPSSAIYGANSSGKSNALSALGMMRQVVLGAVRLNPGDLLPFDPYCLQADGAEEATSLEIDFLLADSRYRYGFEYTRKRIEAEWLYVHTKGDEEQELFEREGMQVDISEKYFGEGRGKEGILVENRLFVSLVAQLNGALSKRIIGWFQNCNGIAGIGGGYMGFSQNMLQKDEKLALRARHFFQQAVLGFEDIRVENVQIDRKAMEAVINDSDLSDGVKRQLLTDMEVSEGEWTEPRLRTLHRVFDSQGHAVAQKLFDYERLESNGTKRLVAMSGPIFHTLEQGGVLIVDELDAQLHPILTRMVNALFMNPDTNPKGAQLIFTLHDTSQMGYLRRDQIWFVEKDASDISHLYSRVEFKDSDADNADALSTEKEYMQGLYGAIPFAPNTEEDER